MRKRNTSFVLLFTALVIGCSTIITDVNYDYDETVDFANLKTYAWDSSRPSSRNDELIIKRIRRVVDEQLAAKGFTAASERPDFLIALQGTKTTKVERWDSQHFDSWDTYTYEEGTLVLDFLDGKTKEPIWRGTAMGVLDPSPTPEEREENANKAVARMLKYFPPHQ